MELKVLQKKELNNFIEKLKKYGEVYIPTKEFTRANFQNVEEVGLENMALIHEPTVRPPKEFAAPSKEKIFYHKKSNGKGEVTRVIDDKERVIFGMHTCDIHAMRTLDTIYTYQYEDPNYLERRKKLTIIGVECMEVCNDVSFCRSMGTWKADEGFDVLLTPVNEEMFVARAGTDKGHKIMEDDIFKTASKDDMLRWLEATREKDDTFPIRVDKNPTQISSALSDNFEHPLWKEFADRCYSCGACNIVCPTCHCYAVKEDVSVDLKSSYRTREWDACMRREFTLEASGHNARNQTEDRLRHRFMKKGKYTLEKFGSLGCVGCGRCIKACLTNISIMEAFDTVEKRTKTIERAKHYTVEPFLSQIKNITTLTKDEKVFELEIHKDFKHRPGQFVEVSLFGVGEAPISISSSPTRCNGTIELCIRATGTVTDAIHNLKPGNYVWLRGPFGNGFDTEIFENKNLLFIAGGLGYAPLRSLIHYVLDNLSKYRDVNILYGTKNPKSFLYKEELEELNNRRDIDFDRIVDVADSSWRGEVGPVTTLIKSRRFDVDRTIAVICGPPVMYKFVLAELRGKGFKEENIYMSLERRMECGVGMCGHCQIEDLYVCLDGPVFQYSKIRAKEEAI